MIKQPKLEPSNFDSNSITASEIVTTSSTHENALNSELKAKSSTFSDSAATNLYTSSKYTEGASKKQNGLNTTSTTVSKDLYDKICNDQDVLTHGYVHGHIHKHKDHTHIHGHIHNHDHPEAEYQIQNDKHTSINNKVTPTQSKLQSQSTTQIPQSIPKSLQNNANIVLSDERLEFDLDSCCGFEKFDQCKDIFCDELDDCYFHACDDTKKETNSDNSLNDSCNYCEDDCDSVCEDDCRSPCESPHVCCEEINCSDNEDIKFLNTLSQQNSHQKGNCCNNPDCFDYSFCGGKEFICNDPNCLDNVKASHNNQHFNCCSSDSTQASKQQQDLLYDACSKSFDMNANNGQHQNNLCDLQLTKKPIFEDLIDKVHKTVDSHEDKTHWQETKKRKLNHHSDQSEDRKGFKKLELHFPHPCHPIPASHPNSSTADDVPNGLPIFKHNVHQSCFHTKIPNSDTTTSDDQIMSDFDFYIQFNNFNKFFNEQVNEQSTSKYNDKFTNINQDLENTFDSVLSQNSNISNSIGSEVYPNKFSETSCMWDNCHRKVSNTKLINHLISDHIEYDSINNFSKGNSTQAYQCEWNDCDFIDDDLNNLVEHLHRHTNTNHSRLNTKSSHNRNEGVPLPNLTPDSLVKSSTNTSPVNSISTRQFDNHTESEKHDRIKIEGTNQLHVTSMKIFPKEKDRGPSCCDSSDGNFTCNWQVDTGDDGLPIPCKKSHESAGDLQKHLIDDHIGQGKSTYHCNWIDCIRHNGKCFTQRQKLLRHIHIHTNYKPCKCEICGSSFAVESMLKQHLRIHSGEKPFSCSKCGKTFATSSSLSIHNRVHTGEKPLVCKWPNCGKKFSESSNLTKHMKLHFKSFKCEVCGEEFDKKSLFVKHTRIHADVKSMNSIKEPQVNLTSLFLNI